MDKEKEMKWFVAKTRAKQEKSVRQQILDAGVEAFVPTRVEIRNWHDRKKKVESVLIPNTVFIRAGKQEALDLHNEKGIQISFVRDITKREPSTALMVIPDVQMQAFMDFINLSCNDYEIVPDVIYMKGDRVIVTKGPFKGVMGELIRIDGDNKVVVKLEQLIACSLNVDMESIEKL